MAFGRADGTAVERLKGCSPAFVLFQTIQSDVEGEYRSITVWLELTLATACVVLDHKRIGYAEDLLRWLLSIHDWKQRAERAREERPGDLRQKSRPKPFERLWQPLQGHIRRGIAAVALSRPTAEARSACFALRQVESSRPWRLAISGADSCVPTGACRALMSRAQINPGDDAMRVRPRVDCARRCDRQHPETRKCGWTKQSGIEHPRRSRVDVSVLSTPSRVPGRIPEIEISSF